MKEKLRVLKAQKTKLLNKQCETMEQFEEIQARLNEIEVQMEIIKGENKNEKV